MNIDFSAIKESKNLLAFSAGIDSTALFFLLLENNIAFDIAIVNYNVRPQSKDELTYAIKLAKIYGKEIFFKEVIIEENSNFEKTARDIRYKFFEEIIEDRSYDTLITAHQLNDKLEWFLMQFSKGAGLFELIGLNTFDKMDTYIKYKPLLEISKDELEEYLTNHKLQYFIDNSNYDEKYTRNYIRHNHSDSFLKEYKKGIINSFKYIQKDLNSLSSNSDAIYKNFELEIFINLNDTNLNIRLIDLSLKRRGILISALQRLEILKQKNIIISKSVAISIEDYYIWIAPVCSITMDKKFKEVCRVNKIPKNMRCYIKDKDINIKELMF
jgi:tRNA(Ile)-lysidine synthase